jgi:hypothetical protein
LRHLGFIPGFGFELGLGMDKSLFFQVAMTSRAHLAKAFVVKAGVGGGISFEYSYYVPAVVGFDLFIKRNLCLTSNLTYFLFGTDAVQGSMRFNAGFAVAGRYEN